jgi:hypothetical protein
MTDRNVFVAAFVTAVLIMAGAFALPPFFFFELAKSTIFVAIAVMVFYGDNRFSYMLGIIAPVLWLIAEILVGSFFTDFRVLVDYMTPNKLLGPLETPLHALSYLGALWLIFVSRRAWKKEVPEKFLGKTFWTCFVISLVYSAVLTVWYLRVVHT